MSKRVKYTAEEKFQIIQEYQEGLGTLKDIASRYNIYRNTITQWIYKFDRYGTEGLVESSTWRNYSRQLKEDAIRDYLSGELQLKEVVRKYEISDHSVFLKWIKKYNSHSEVKVKGKGMSQSMTKGRTTTLKEKMEIVLSCIANGLDYKNTADAYKVSYQQVYQWVKKYESGGEAALKDGRGRKKDDEELTQEEKIRLEMKRIKAENERLRAENAFLKKLEELERRRS
ncbi:Transposase and inactivated derivatives [Natronincola peptidivorans]|uniref:Transposase and inactivated derivatives n=1 Tax=Natronincola peptidivorans TaxID=426128 RepID=A0A1I0HIN4_9FIRM|nr:Transposase and inactivated derivatives [Natronincola peptidivorans]